MTIQGGGGGKKIPGAPGTPATSGAPQQPATSAPPTKPAATTTTTATTAPPSSDGFEHTRTDPRFGAARASLPASDVVTGSGASGIANMVRILEETRAQILDEHKALRDKATRLVAALAQAGFERALVDQKRAELNELRQRLAALRKRLQHIQRRLKTALGKTAKHGDVDLGKSIQAHLDKMKKLEPGVQRALLALLAMEQAAAGLVDGGVLKLAGDATAEARGQALAELAPGSVIARATTALLSGAPSSAPAQPDDVADADAGVTGMRAVAETLLASF